MTVKIFGIKKNVNENQFWLKIWSVWICIINTYNGVNLICFTYNVKGKILFYFNIIKYSMFLGIIST